MSGLPRAAGGVFYRGGKAQYRHGGHKSRIRLDWPRYGVYNCSCKARISDKRQLPPLYVDDIHEGDVGAAAHRAAVIA